MYAGFAKKTQVIRRRSTPLVLNYPACVDSISVVPLRVCQNMADSLLEKALILDGFAHSLTILRATRQISEALSVCDAVRTELEETRIDWDELRTPVFDAPPVFAAPDAATHEPRPIFTGIRSGGASGCTRRHREGAAGRAGVSLLAQ